jgi:NAD(P)-dependent dehydrogenase (short-subunit alcohol dehydrogenase family)
MSDVIQGLRILVTGATSGVGEALVQQLAQRGASVLVHGRDPVRVHEVRTRLLAAGGKAEAFVANLASLAEVGKLANELSAAGGLDVLVNNAGVGFGQNRALRELSADGFELRLAVNYLAPFLLTELLTLRNLPARAVVNVASAGQAALDHSDLMSERGYEGVLAYRRSKLALIADTFQRALRDRERAYLALHPGTFLATKMVREANITPRGSAESGAQAVLGVLERGLAGQSGAYFDRDSPAEADPSASDPDEQAWLRGEALRLTAPFRGNERGVRA